MERWEQGYAPAEELEYVGIRYATEVYDMSGELVCDCERAEDAALIVRLHTHQATLVDALRQIAQWTTEAYPAEAFPDQDLAAARSLLAAAGIDLSAIHGQWARHLIGGIGAIAQQALEEERGR